MCAASARRDGRFPITSAHGGERSYRSGLGLLRESVKEAVRDRFDSRPPPPIGKGRVEVRDRLRQMFADDQALRPTQRQHRLLEQKEFESLCTEVGGISDQVPYLIFCTTMASSFIRQGIFRRSYHSRPELGLEAIYSIFHRDKMP